MAQNVQAYQVVRCVHLLACGHAAGPDVVDYDWHIPASTSFAVDLSGGLDGLAATNTHRLGICTGVTELLGILVL